MSGGSSSALADLASAVAEARRRVARGDPVDLRHLADLAAGGPGLAGGDAAGRAALLDELERLVEAVGRERDAAAARLAGLAARGRAARAYGGARGG